MKKPHRKEKSEQYFKGNRVAKVGQIFGDVLYCKKPS